MSPRKLENEVLKEEPLEEQKEEVKETKRHETILDAREPVKILTEKDAYIADVLDSQPKTLEDIDRQVAVEVHSIDEELGIHRLSLPEFFEEFSYDCTRGIKCPHHGWIQEEIHYSLEHTMKRWKQMKFGKYVFRWFLNRRRAIDEAKNLHGWFIVNRSYFPDAPRILFSIKGAVEEGDNILGFMPQEKALRKRNRPSKMSVEKLKSEKEKFKDNPNFYEAELSPEKAEGDDYAPSDALQEGRDF